MLIGTIQVGRCLRTRSIHTVHCWKIYDSALCAFHKSAAFAGTVCIQAHGLIMPCPVQALQQLQESLGRLNELRPAIRQARKNPKARLTGRLDDLEEEMQDCWDRRHAAELELRRLYEEVLENAKVEQLCIPDIYCLTKYAYQAGLHYEIVGDQAQPSKIVQCICRSVCAQPRHVPDTSCMPLLESLRVLM